ncbi:N-acetylglucosaminyl transferase component Gpi1 [Trichodelitschia bisporula]|uniref:N-acetylglucosaminyl transferase component Gpi1 n=1 Tax=Trichodelitschia bisporula TaxID=703511 RepID=A0A6G1HVC1_9PEZI|nr:N-acetylglucosaminyl transferase component Gpi1 [Trichodelitschia bisporula]
MHPFSGITLGIFVAGYITARWDLVTRLYELAIFAWDHGVVTRAAKGFTILSIFFFLFIIPIERLAVRETDLVRLLPVALRQLTPQSTPAPPAAASPRASSSSAAAPSKIAPMLHNGLMRIFWPSDAPTEARPGVLVGFRNSELDMTVVAVLQDVELRSVDNALRLETLYRNSPYAISLVLERCGKGALQVLGTVNPRSPPAAFNPASIVVSIDRKTRFPRLYTGATALMFQIILFDRPHPTQMQYLSLSPISLALGDKAGEKGFPPLDGVEAAEERERRRKEALVEKLRQHTVVWHAHTPKEKLLPIIIEQINCSFELNALLQRNVGLVGSRPRRALSVSERVVKSATNLWDYVLLALWHVIVIWIYPVFARLFVVGLIVHRMAAELVLHVLDWRLFPGHAALKDVSATAQQVDIRLQQFCYWPKQYLTLRRRKQTWQSITHSHPEYIRFYNSLWLVANDVIIGIALGSYIIDNADLVALQLDRVLDAWTIDGLQRMIAWLMDWPAGLKLNTELATFLGDLFLWVIDYWAGCMAVLRPHLPAVVRFIGFSAFAGATMPISLFSDLVSVLTLHVYSFYAASARIFHWQLTIIMSLFHLFRGKKNNVLRSRIDSCDYDLDQLLLGTILFTLLFFLLPTVFVFYITFAGARMAIIMLKAGLDTCLACLNHFPLFALMLRFKDSRRLPGGIKFELCVPPVQEGEAHVALVHLKSVPLPLSAMLNSYVSLGNRIRKHYASPGVMLCLATGRFVPPIHRKNLYSLQYSMLPAKRVGIGQLWQELSEEVGGLGQENGKKGVSRRR